MSMDIAHSSSDHATRTSLSLSQMMLLPEDEDYSKEDHQYASLTKDLDAMVNLSVDEGESKTAVIMYTYFCMLILRSGHFIIHPLSCQVTMTKKRGIILITCLETSKILIQNLLDVIMIY